MNCLKFIMVKYWKIYQFNIVILLFIMTKKINSEDYSSQIKYYTSMFNVPYTNINLPISDCNSNNGKVVENLYRYETNSEVYETVNRIIKKNNLSKTTFFFIMYCLTMSIYTGQNYIYMEIVSSNRANTYAENLVGLFAKYIPVLVKLENITLIELLKKYKNILLTIFSYDIPYSKILTELSLQRCSSKFKFDPYELKNNDELNYIQNISNYEISKMFNINEFELRESENNDLTFVIEEKENSYEIIFLYKSIYDDFLIQNIINTFISIIKDENLINSNINKIVKTIKKINNPKLQNLDENENKNIIKQQNKNEKIIKQQNKNSSINKSKSKRKSRKIRKIHKYIKIFKNFFSNIHF